MNEMQEVLKQIGPGKMSHTAYDTAWVARMGDIDPDLGSQALEWISENQLPDGSWGARDTYYYHDRVISTLAAMIALAHRGRHVRDKNQIEKGLIALERITATATKGLAVDSNRTTVGFEMIVPTLIAEAEQLGIIKQQKERILGKLAHIREIKMKKLAGIQISRFITIAHSSEMTGRDKMDLLEIENLQEKNGSVGNSPAASAYFANSVRKGDEKAMSYLKNVMHSDGGVSFAAPFDIFERSWVLWNLALTGKVSDEIRALCKPHIAHLVDKWDKQNGVSFSETYTPKDGDDTSITFSALSQFGISLDVQAVLNYEEKEYFRCYSLEANSSISVNVHALEALKQAGFEKEHPSAIKIIKYLQHNQTEYTYWLDKWHISPYYPTSHAIIAAHHYDFEMCERAINWILQTQKADGSWGSIPNFSTAEETAYCIQALKIWEKYHGKIQEGRVAKALLWLEKNCEPPYPSLWIGKALYCPVHVVRSTILSALELARQ
jgi:halimadienyl-diphosphate synthase